MNGKSVEERGWHRGESSLNWILMRMSVLRPKEKNVFTIVPPRPTKTKSEWMKWMNERMNEWINGDDVDGYK